MATSLVVTTSDKNKTIKPPPALCVSSEEGPPKTEPPRSGRGRKANNNSKGPNQKKQPQRGMGVAQLESILRVQEMNQVNRSSSPSSSPSPSSVTTPLLSPPSFPVVNTDPFAGNLPTHHHYAASPNHGPLHHHCPPPPLMFNGNVVIPGGSGQGPAANNVVFSNVIGATFGPSVWSPLVGCPLETSRELSSMPNPHPDSHPCVLCFKKKRFTTDDNIPGGSNTRRDSSALDIWSMIHGTDHFQGFSPQQALNLPPAETTDFTTRMSTHNAHSYRNLDEVVAVQRKVSGSTSGKILMEYEFFPGKEDARGTSFKDMGLSLVASSSSVTAAASARARNADTTAAAANSNSVDLSLRL